MKLVLENPHNESGDYVAPEQGIEYVFVPGRGGIITVRLEHLAKFNVIAMGGPATRALYGPETPDPEASDSETSDRETSDPETPDPATPTTTTTGHHAPPVRPDGNRQPRPIHRTAPGRSETGRNVHVLNLARTATGPDAHLLSGTGDSLHPRDGTTTSATGRRNNTTAGTDGSTPVHPGGTTHSPGPHPQTDSIGAPPSEFSSEPPAYDEIGSRIEEFTRAEVPWDAPPPFDADTPALDANQDQPAPPAFYYQALRRSGLLVDENFFDRASYRDAGNDRTELRRQRAELERQSSRVAVLRSALLMRRLGKRGNTNMLSDRTQAELVSMGLSRYESGLAEWGVQLRDNRIRPSLSVSEPEPGDLLSQGLLLIPLQRPPGLAGTGPDPRVAAVWWQQHGRQWWTTLDFAARTAAQQRQLLTELPGLRNGEGIPRAVRDELNRAHLRLELDRLSHAPAGETVPQQRHRDAMVEDYTRFANLLVAADLEAGITTARQGRALPPVHLLSFTQDDRGRGAVVISIGPADTADYVTWRVAPPDASLEALTGELVDAAEACAASSGAIHAAVVSAGHDDLHGRSGSSHGAQPISPGAGFSRLRNLRMLFTAVSSPAALRPGASRLGEAIMAYATARRAGGARLRGVEVFASRPQAAAMMRHVDRSIVTIHMPGQSLQATQPNHPGNCAPRALRKGKNFNPSLRYRTPEDVVGLPGWNAAELETAANATLQHIDPKVPDAHAIVVDALRDAGPNSVAFVIDILLAPDERGFGAHTLMLYNADGEIRVYDPATREDRRIDKFRFAPSSGTAVIVFAATGEQHFIPDQSNDGARVLADTLIGAPPSPTHDVDIHMPDAAAHPRRDNPRAPPARSPLTDWYEASEETHLSIPEFAEKYSGTVYPVGTVLQFASFDPDVLGFIATFGHDEFGHNSVTLISETGNTRTLPPAHFWQSLSRGNSVRDLSVVTVTQPRLRDGYISRVESIEDIGVTPGLRTKIANNDVLSGTTISWWELTGDGPEAVSAEVRADGKGLDIRRSTIIGSVTMSRSEIDTHLQNNQIPPPPSHSPHPPGGTVRRINTSCSKPSPMSATYPVGRNDCRYRWPSISAGTLTSMPRTSPTTYSTK